MTATLNTTIIQNASSSTPNITLDTAGNASFGGMPYGASSFLRNRIINGSMGIDQRNSGAAQTITAAAALAYTVDRWYAYCTGANVTGQRVTNAGTTASPSQYAYQFTGSASVTAIGFAQRIEAVNSYDLAGSTATLSVNLANSVLTTVTWTAYYANTTDTFGTLASPTVTQIATGTFTVTSTLTRYSTNISIPSAATTGIQILFTVGAQTSGTWTIGNVQLEAGSVATPFERRQITNEIVLCERYFQTSYDFGNAPGSTGSGSNGAPSHVTDATASYPSIQIIFRTRMRVQPTMTIYSPNTGASGKIYNSNASTDVAGSLSMNGQSGATTYVNNVSIAAAYLIQAHYSAVAEL